MCFISELCKRWLLAETSLSGRHEKGSTPFALGFDEIIVIEYGKVKTNKKQTHFQLHGFYLLYDKLRNFRKLKFLFKAFKESPKIRKKLFTLRPILKLLTSIWIFSSWNPGKRLCQKLADRCGFCGFWTDYCATDMRIVLFTIEPSNIPPYLPPQT